MRNLKFEYLYRDAGNYKIFGSLYIKNNLLLPLDYAEFQIRQGLIDGEYFYPQELGINLFSEHLNPSNIFDGWYEFEQISETEEVIKYDFQWQDFISRLTRE
ncbi:hypothetical protein [Christiangramia aquimixticola]|uniref:hypothetical protein n=1 Tax=Christiangramia aquimixticola TaxID=1697558 RepID=UPI003AA80B9C